MASWKVELDRAAVRELGKFDQQTARRILAFLHGRVAALDDPRSIGEALKGSNLGEFWKYRVGDYRVIAHIEDDALRVLVVRVGRRDKVYRAKYKLHAPAGGSLPRKEMNDDPRLMSKIYKCPFCGLLDVEWDVRCACAGTDDYISDLVDGGFEPESATAAFIVLARHWTDEDRESDDYISDLVAGGFKPESATAACIVLARHCTEFKTLTEQQEIAALKRLWTFEGREPAPNHSIKFGSARLRAKKRRGRKNEK